MALGAEVYVEMNARVRGAVLATLSTRLVGIIAWVALGGLLHFSHYVPKVS
jgi:hypothetical protein